MGCKIGFFNSSKIWRNTRATGFPPAFLFFVRNLRTPFTAHMPSKQSHTKTYVKNRIKHMQEMKLQALAQQQKVMAEYIKEVDLDKTTTLELGLKVYLKCISINPPV